MYFIGQQIVRKMEEMGYPSKIYTHFRTPAEQAQKKREGLSRAGPWQSPHQYGEAVDIASANHPAWPPQHDPYWEALRDAVNVVEQELGVSLSGGFDWGWDYAHIELSDWRRQRYVADRRKPTQDEMDQRFQEVLPRRWKQFARSIVGRDHISRNDHRRSYS
ncbi:MAG: M15 family metallopeptidase [Pseudomonadota bacterium]